VVLVVVGRGQEERGLKWSGSGTCGKNVGGLLSRGLMIRGDWGGVGVWLKPTVSTLPYTLALLIGSSSALLSQEWKEFWREAKEGRS
jgi:hypothetical protein